MITFSSPQSGLLRRQRLLREDVERGAAEVTRAQRVDECILIDDSAAADVDEDRARVHALDAVAVDEAACLLGQRQRHDDRVGLREQLVEVALVTPHGDDVHPECLGKAGDLAADRTEADDEHDGAAQLVDGVVVPVPVALVGEQARQALREGEDAEDAPFGERRRVHAGSSPTGCARARPATARPPRVADPHRRSGACT